MEIHKLYHQNQYEKAKTQKEYLNILADFT
jgi:hypothetical protein